MNLLAIDSFSPILSIAVSRKDEIYYSQANALMAQSEIAMDEIDRQMRAASLKPNELNGILCAGGPGSFTGLRIGFSIAKGLALSLSIPFASVPTLDCVAYDFTESLLSKGETEVLLAVVQAAKNTWFYAFFINNERVSPDGEADLAVLTNEIMTNFTKNNKKIKLTGPGSQALFSSLSNELKKHLILDNKISGYAKELIFIAKKRNILDNDSGIFLHSGPEYIRVSDAQAALERRV